MRFLGLALTARRVRIVAVAPRCQEARRSHSMNTLLQDDETGSIVASPHGLKAPASLWW